MMYGKVCAVYELPCIRYLRVGCVFKSASYFFVATVSTLVNTDKWGLHVYLFFYLDFCFHYVVHALS